MAASQSSPDSAVKLAGTDATWMVHESDRGATVAAAAGHKPVVRSPRRAAWAGAGRARRRGRRSRLSPTSADRRGQLCMDLRLYYARNTTLGQHMPARGRRRVHPPRATGVAPTPMKTASSAASPHPVTRRFAGVVIFVRPLRAELTVRCGADMSRPLSESILGPSVCATPRAGTTFWEGR